MVVNMKKNLIIVLLTAISVWSIPKPMEAIENYNVLMVHGAYGSDKGIPENMEYVSAYEDTVFLGNVTLGDYTSNNRITKWLMKNVFEESISEKNYENARNSYIYNWRSFTNPANTSLNNGYELAYRKWNKDGTFGKRRALFEEAQEVKAVYDTLHGQSALEIIRKDPDLYRQLPSRYILIGHSMGGVVSREYVQGNFYNGDVDKIITLDSPHEGTGTMNMTVKMNAIDDFWGHLGDNLESTVLSVVPRMLVLGNVGDIGFAISSITSNLVKKEIGDLLATYFAPEYYVESDPLLHYVDPKQTGFGTIDSLNGLSYEADSMPMIRILSGQHGMTMSDPGDLDDGFSGGIRTFIPDYAAMPYLNYNTQLEGSGDMSARYVNALTSFIMGYAGIPVQETGSSIVPDHSSKGGDVIVLNDSKVDIERAYFNAAPLASNTLGNVAVIIESVTNQVRDLDLMLGYVCAPCASATKVALGFAGAEQAAPSIIPAAVAGFIDLSESHQIPLYWDNLDTMMADTNIFPMQMGVSTYTPYLMEDFLYERPFVNLALNDIRTLNMLSPLSPDSIEKSPLNRNCYYIGSKSGKTCAIGLFSRKDTLNSFQQEQNLSALTPLLFKSESDWSKMGVKVDRWEKVDGLHPDGSENEKGVPIRHVERYVVPDNIVVQNYIEKYSFVVDDLMPHRLREIYMNFNFQRELVWECNIEIDPTENNACKVYKRRVGEAWPTEPLMTVPHPVLKNGRFDFNARDYFNSRFGDDLSAIQKGNQNTVTISVINKIGLSNTQRFSYLYKSARNLFEPSWPLRDIVVNKIDGFGGTASYQGLGIVGAKDSIFRCLDVDCRSTDSVASRRALAMSPTTEGKHFASGQAVNKPAEGSFFWVFNATSDNNGSLDSSDMNLVPFVVDTTAPKFSLRTDSYCVNPDSSVFLVRVKVNDDSSAGTGKRGAADIRAMHWTLERKNGGVFNKVADLPYLYDVASNDFAVDWAGVDKKSLRDGLYRVKATAIDYALPNMAAYVAVNNLSEKIVGKTASEADWDNVILHHKLNVGRDSVEFRVDRVAPTLPRIELRALPAEPGKNSKYASLPKLARSGNQYAYVSKDSLLNISYTVREELNGRSGTPVLVSWNFRHVPDSNAVVRAMDSLWMGGDTVSGTWAEEAGLLLEDGEYRIFAVARDEAKNISSPIEVSKKLRVDRTAPRVENVVSTLPVYDKSSNKAFEVSVTVSESGDVTANRTGMRCSYRVLGGQAENTWRAISSSALHSGTRTFNVDKNLIGNNDGKRYLEVACIDMAGNVGVSTSLFYVGKRYPNIVFPTESDYLQMPVIPIVGIAPPDFGDAENTAVYRLR